jgi:hypothetical protein
VAALQNPLFTSLEVQIVYLEVIRAFKAGGFSAFEYVSIG